MVQRLPRYLAQVQQLHSAGTEWISSRLLAEQLGLTSSTVRQDFTHLDFRGTSRRGYATAELLDRLACMLGVDRHWNVVVAGAGNLGRALVLHEEFARRGFRIKAVFDCDPAKIGSRIGTLEVLPMALLADTIRLHGCRIGILAVPAAAAQDVAERMMAAGLTGLLNMALTHIAAPAGIAVVDSRIVANLFELTHLISMQPGAEGAYEPVPLNSAVQDTVAS